MTQLAFDLRHPLEILNAPRGPSDPELWEALHHPDGYERARALLHRRHGSDREALAADLDGFRAPNPIRWPGPGPAPHWAGWLAVLKGGAAQLSVTG